MNELVFVVVVVAPQKPKKISRILAAVGKKSSLVDLFKRKSSDATHDSM